MVSTRPSSRITTPLPTRSVPRSGAVNASSGISARSSTTASSARVEVEAPVLGPRPHLGRELTSLFFAMSHSDSDSTSRWRRRRGARAPACGARDTRRPGPRCERPWVVTRERAMPADLHQQLGLGAHRLDHHDLGRDAGRPQVDVLRPDAVFHALAFVPRAPAAGQRAPSASTAPFLKIPSNTFIAGEPMNCATNRLAGRS